MPEDFATPSALVGVDGAACRLPGAVDSASKLAATLRSSGDAVNLVPAKRWVAGAHQNSHAALAAGVERFGASFFGISRAEADMMDPQQRLVLELGYQALHGASQRRGT
eukprot:1484353-Prymnesium_polylepis.1